METNTLKAVTQRAALTGLFTLALAGLALVIGGCASATVTPTIVAGPLPKPDMIIVRNFAVTPAEVKLDRGIMASAVRDAQDRSPSDEEVQVGHLVADKLASSLVEELRAAGIPAARGSDNVRITETTAIICGEFMTIDQGNQSERVWIGFGMGGSELRTRLQVIQGDKLVAQADTATKSSLKPGMLTSLGVGAAAGTATPIVVGAAGTGVSETLLSTVEADAKRTAKEIAKKIKQAYVDRGWLAN